MIISEASSVLQTVDHIHGIPKDSYEKEVETPNRNGTGALKSEIWMENSTKIFLALDK